MESFNKKQPHSKKYYFFLDLQWLKNTRHVWNFLFFVCLLHFLFLLFTLPPHPSWSSTWPLFTVVLIINVQVISTDVDSMESKMVEQLVSAFKIISTICTHCATIWWQRRWIHGMYMTWKEGRILFFWFYVVLIPLVGKFIVVLNNHFVALWWSSRLIEDNQQAYKAERKYILWN